MNLREHLESVCSTKVWKTKSGKVRVVEKGNKGKWLVLESDIVPKILNNSTMKPNEVIYINYYEDETTMYLLNAGGGLKAKNVMLLNPKDKTNEWSFWAMIRKNLGLQIPKNIKTPESHSLGWKIEGADGNITSIDYGNSTLSQ